MSSDNSQQSEDASPSEAVPAKATSIPAPLNPLERRILGVLMEKARTTPDAYPLSLSGLVAGCNQKSNRHPVMNLTMEQVEDVLLSMRHKQLIAEVHSGGRVPKYRHYGYDYMGVKGVEAGVMAELLLRGEQTAGELRTRASRFEPIADLSTMQQILNQLIDRGLVVALTQSGRGQMFTHNLYDSHELEKLKQSLGNRVFAQDEPTASDSPSRGKLGMERVEHLQGQIDDLRSVIEELRIRIDRLES